MAASLSALGSETRRGYPLWRALSPAVALYLPWIRTASYLARVCWSGRGGIDEPARARFAPLLGAKVALDEWTMALGSFAEIPSRSHVRRIHEEVTHSAELFEARGWLRDPKTYHVTPPPLCEPRLRSKRTALAR